MRRTPPVLCLVSALFVLAGCNRDRETPATPILRIESGGPAGNIRWIDFTPDGRHLLTTGDDKALRVWDVLDKPQPRQVRTLRFQIGPGQEGRIHAAAVHPRSDVLAVGIHLPESHRNDVPIFIVDFYTGQVLSLLKGHKNTVLQLAFSPDGRWLASAAADKTMKLWAAPQDLSEGSWKCTATLAGHKGLPTSLTWAADSQRLASSDQVGSIAGWRLKPGGSSWAAERSLAGHKNGVSDLAWSPDGRHLASGGGDTIRLWDLASGKVVRTLTNEGRNVPALAFTPDGRYLLSGMGWGKKGHAQCRVWSTANWREARRFRGHEGSVAHIAVSTQNGLVATAGFPQNDVWIWEVKTAEPKAHIAGTGRTIVLVAFSEDGRRIAFGDPLRVKEEPLGTFDLSTMTLGPDSRDVDQWHWAPRSLGSLKAERRAKNALAVVRNGRDVARVERPHKDDPIRGFGFTQDGKLIVGSAAALTLHDPRTGEQLCNYQGVPGEVMGVAVSPDGRLLLASGFDHTFRLWNIDTGELLLTVFPGRDREWVAWTPQGYYKSSPAGDRLIGWHLNQGFDRPARFVAAWQMRRRLERPDVIERIPETADVAAALQLADAERATGPALATTVKDLPKLLPPQVILHEPTPGAHVKGREVRVRATVQSKLPLTKVTVLVNGRPLRGFGGTAQQTDLAAVLETVTLVSGDNVISVVAENEAGTGEPASVRVFCTMTQTSKPCVYLLAIGVSRYADDSLSLGYPAADARGLVQAFTEQAGHLYGQVQPRLLLDREATRANVRAGLLWLNQSAKQNDMAVVAFAGHGDRDQDGRFLFLPHDADRRDLASTCLTDHDLRQGLCSLPCRTLLIMDACHSGAVTGRGLDLTPLVKDMASAEVGIVTMTGSTGREQSQESDQWRHGAFSLALIEGLTSRRHYRSGRDTRLPADANSDGQIILEELAAFIVNRVTELTRGAQHPTLQRGDVPSFTIAVVR